MAFLKSGWSVSSAGHPRSSHRDWNYNTADAEATVEASGYFNDVASYLSVGDFINVFFGEGGSNGSTILRVATNDGTTVTTADMLSFGTIELTQGNILRGSSAGVAEVLAASGNGNVLAGNGTTIVSEKLAGRHVDAINGGSLSGFIPVVFTGTTSGGTTEDIQITVDHKVRITGVEAIVRGTGTASDTLTIKYGSNAITNAIDCNVADKTIVRATTIDDAYYEIPIGGVLVMAQVDGGGADCPILDIMVSALRVP